MCVCVWGGGGGGGEVGWGDGAVGGLVFRSVPQPLHCEP